MCSPPSLPPSLYPLIARWVIPLAVITQSAVTQWAITNWLITGLLIFLMQGSTRADEIGFEPRIRTILAEKCATCHGGLRREGDLDTRSWHALRRGGVSGPAITQDRNSSLLWQRIVAQEMPPTDAPRLTEQELADLEAWLQDGAQEPDRPDAGLDDPTGIEASNLADANFWSFQPLQMVVPPTIPTDGKDHDLTPVDRFLLMPLARRGLTFAPLADRATWLRRVYLDLIGLPPSPEELQRFEADTSPTAYEHVVDQLLASPHYGERWGRLWLDVVGYADSNGYIRHDSPRPLAYHYRDYVIRAWNQDKPYDQLWREQLAGDEIVQYHQTTELTAVQLEQLIATHFLRNAPDGTDHTEGNEITRVMERYAVLEAQLQITMSAMFGITIDCARCHSHKFDPIPQRDYYALQAIFYPAFPVQGWVQPKDRWIHAVSAAESERWKLANEQVNAHIATLQAEFKTWQDAQPDGSSEAFKKELEARQQQLAAAISTWEQQRPVEPPRIAWATDLRVPAPDVPILKRGDYFQHGASVSPGALSVLSDVDHPLVVSSQDAAARTTGRRTAFANWATQSGSRAAALLARVQINRLWKAHFGLGLVPTPENFGASGLPPTHPELLEWLAAELQRNHWQQKPIQRMLVLSRAYRQSSATDSVDRPHDVPPPEAYAYFTLHRLEAEQIRDAMLAASGALHGQMSGPPVEFVDVGTRQITLPDPVGFGPHATDRRSVYIRYRRSQPLTFLQAFDQPAPDPNCLGRSTSCVVSQSLALLNSSFAVRIGKALANRVSREHAQAGTDPVSYAFRLALARYPTDAERQACGEFLTAQTLARCQHGESHDASHQAAWADLCRMLMASNEFLSAP